MWRRVISGAHRAMTTQASNGPRVLPSRPADGVLRLALNEPVHRNPLSVATMQDLQAALASAEHDASIRVIILASTGPAFSAGHDLKEITSLRAAPDLGEAAFHALFAQCAAVMEGIVAHPVPIIAEVQGIATAAGCQLVASCDLAVAAQTARFAAPGVNIGLFCSTPMVPMSRNMPRKHAMRMLLTGEPIGAEEALRLGLISHVAAPEALTADTLALASLIASKPRAAIALGKAAFYAQLEMRCGDAYRSTVDVMTANMLNRDALEGIDAFIGKRRPHWPSNEIET